MCKKQCNFYAYNILSHKSAAIHFKILYIPTYILITRVHKKIISIIQHYETRCTLKFIFQNFLTKTRYPYWAQLLVWAITAVCLLLILAFCMVDNRKNLSVKFKESLSQMKKKTGGHIKRSDTDLSGKGIITEIDVSIYIYDYVRIF